LDRRPGLESLGNQPPRSSATSALRHLRAHPTRPSATFALRNLGAPPAPRTATSAVRHLGAQPLHPSTTPTLGLPMLRFFWHSTSPGSVPTEQPLPSVLGVRHLRCSMIGLTGARRFQRPAARPQRYRASRALCIVSHMSHMTSRTSYMCHICPNISSHMHHTCLMYLHTYITRVLTCLHTYVTLSSHMSSRSSTYLPVAHPYTTFVVTNV